MPTIILETKISAPLKEVFDIARSVDVHMKSTSQTNEKAIGGKVSGLVVLGDEITWQAKHFGLNQKLKVKIIEFEYLKSFTDEMVFGAFQSMKHHHIFEEKEDYVLMKDEFIYHAPLGILGRLAEKLFLTKYMKTFLLNRNQYLKDTVEANS
ncbi:MAG: cell division protein [Planctomycetota bacterium]|nr:MAG: cell division protein [Planctomycetota bacterium]